MFHAILVTGVRTDHIPFEPLDIPLCVPGELIESLPIQMGFGGVASPPEGLGSRVAMDTVGDGVSGVADAFTVVVMVVRRAVIVQLHSVRLSAHRILPKTDRCAVSLDVTTAASPVLRSDTSALDFRWAKIASVIIQFPRPIPAFVRSIQYMWNARSAKIASTTPICIRRC